MFLIPFLCPHVNGKVHFGIQVDHQRIEKIEVCNMQKVDLFVPDNPSSRDEQVGAKSENILILGWPLRAHASSNGLDQSNTVHKVVGRGIQSIVFHELKYY